MTLIHYRRFSNFFLSASIVLFTVSIVSAVFIVIAEFPMKLSLNPKGFENFISYFGFPMKTLAATLATFAVWLTLERLLQTEKQINAITDNNKFNNYPRHQQEFVDFMKNTSLFSGLSKIEEVDPSVYLVPLYKTNYAKTYEEFTPRMQESVKIKIDKFYKKIANSSIESEHCDLSTVPFTEITKISSEASEEVRELIIPFTEKVFLRMHVKYVSTKMSADQIQLIKDRFQELHVIAWTIAFYRSLLAFDGEISKYHTFFPDNFERFENGLGV